MGGMGWDVLPGAAPTEEEQTTQEICGGDRN